MKALFSFALCALLSNAAMAMPNVGDFAVYEVNANGMIITQKLELTSYNAASGKFTQVETTSFQGQQQQQTTLVNGADLPSEALIEQIMAACTTPAINGVIETVTVPAGTFSTCAFSDSQSGMRLNYGSVPFGIIQLDGPGISAKLLQYKK